MAEKNLEEMREAVEAIREKMAAAAREAGRDPAEVQLCAACKTRTADTVAASAALAIDVFGENHVQELCANYDAGAYCGKPSHFIGHLQTNKIKKVLGGVAGAAGLALSEDDRTLYVSDLGNRCIWSVDADARELTAGGKNCGSFVSGLPGYPGALALDEDGTLYISYRWTRSGWLEKHADSTLLRGIALRAGENIQKKLFKLPADAPCAEAVDTADGSWKQTFSGRELDGCTAVCPAGSKVYFGAAGSASLLSARV